MKRSLFFLIILFSSALLLTVPANAQVGFGNIQSTQVDDLSDEQVLQFLRQAQSQGLTVQEVGSIARARGMPASEVSKLVARMSRLETGRVSDGVTRIQSTTRSAAEVSQQFERARPTDDIGNELLIMELERLVDEREEADLLRELQNIIHRGFPMFGADLFQRRALSFEPPLNIPTPEDYVFGTDDEIIINIWGASEATHRVIVSPEGYIRIPSLGPIRISGLTVEEARERIFTNLKQIYSGINLSNPEAGNTYADISLGSVRSISVTMIGEVTQPGAYTVSSLASVFNMLYAAGGPGRVGSWRNIEVIRGEEVITTFDLYDLLVYGNAKNNIRLKDQDIIKIPPYINRVRLSGEVKRPGIFELKEGETLGDLIEFTGGFSEIAYKERIVLHRKSNIKRSISDVKWPDGASLELKNGDEIEIGEIIKRYENRVQIEGAVFREGDYELTEGMTLLDLIEKAEGVREDAYRERGIIFRTRDNLMLESIQFSLQDIMDGRAGDIELRQDDLVRISSIFDLQEALTIAVRGAVIEPGRFEYLENMTLQDAIFLSNGLRDEAAAYRVEVARRVVDVDTRVKVNQVAEVFQFDIDENFRFRGEDSEFRLQPFDMVFVRTKPNYQRQLTVRIEGEVQFPGEYVLERRDARLSDLIAQAGGLSEFAYTKGASMRRILEIRAGDENGNGAQTDGLSALEGVDLGSLNLEGVDLRRRTSETDTVFTPVGIRLEEALNTPKGVNDLRLQEGDVIRIPRQFQTIRVEGGVLSPVSMRYVPGRGLQNYIDAAGGTTDRGQRHRAYIVYANGEVDRTRRFLFMRSNPTVEPGATIFVPEKPASRQMTPQETIALASSIATTTLLFITILDRIQGD